MSHTSRPHQAIQVLQINLRHSRLATAALSQVLLDLDTDVALVQEPYASRFNCESPPVIPYLPDSFEALHFLDSNHHYGAAIVAKKSLRCQLLPNLSGNHIIAVQLELDGYAFILLSIYLRPSLPSLEAELSLVLNRAFTLLPRVVVGADVNAKSPLWNSSTANPRGRELEALLARFPLNVCNQPVANLPFTPTETSFIDVTLASNSVTVSNWHFPDIPSLSDHPFISFTVVSPGPRVGKPFRLCNLLPPLQSINKEKFQNLLCAAFARHHTLLSSDATRSPANIDDAVGLIVELISSCARNSRLPLPPLSTTGRMPWWNDGLARLRRDTRKARKRWITCAAPEKAVSRVNFQQAKALYQKALRRAIELEWIDFCARTSDENLLDSLKELSGKQTRISFPPQLIVNDNKVSEPTEILNVLAQHFFPQPSTLTGPLIAPSSAPARFLAEQPSLSVPPISPSELAESIASLNSSASPGLDGISPGLLSLAAPIIHPLLLTVLNNALSCSYFPSQWRHAKVKVIPKLNKANYSLPSSYRPISIVCSLSKVFEKIILSRLQWLAKSYDWLHDHQHGFREAKSTETAAHQLVSFVEEGFERGHTSAVAFIDIQSAFDKASHLAITSALRKKGCPEYLVRMIRSFLFQRVASLCHDSISVSVNLSTGCPQGSVLSAFLWLILVDDVLKLSFDFHFLTLAYADDVTLAASHKDPSIATAHTQAICDEVVSWARTVDLSINAAKTTFVLFSRRRTRPPDISLNIDSLSITPVNEVQYLGFILDQRLSWSSHLQAKCLAAKKLIFLVRKCLAVTWGLSASRLKKLYSSTIEPTLLYGCSVWCPVISNARSVAAIRSTQRLMALIILRAFKATSTEACLALCGFLPLDLRIAELAAGRLLVIRSPFSPRAAQTLHKFFPNLNLSLPCAVPSRHFSAFLPPWLHPPLLPLVILPPEGPIPLLPLEPTSIRIFTDGSVIGGCTGYGLVVVNSAGLVATCRGKLPDDCSIFQAEGQAILQALRYTVNLDPLPSLLEIFSDSRAALVASLSSERIARPFQEIRSTLLSFPCKTQLFWIASHRGHQGNEIADVLAKLGALGPGTHTDILPPPISSIRLKIRQTVWKIWSKQWTECPKAAITRAFFPSIESTKLISTIELPRQVVQILSGHCRLRSYLFRISCALSPSCSCGKSDETVSHFLFECHLFETLRRQFKDTSCRFCLMWPPPLASIIALKPLLKSFITFILKSKHLDPHPCE
jgi:ribonuclease HI